MIHLTKGFFLFLYYYHIHNDVAVCPSLTVVVIVSVGGYEAVILNETSGNITRMCWITDPYIHYIVNIGFYALVLIFIMIVTTIVQTKNIRSTDGKRKTFRKQLMMVLSLFLLFGLTWSVRRSSVMDRCTLPHITYSLC
ncbi:hypothetical protein cypCar_00043294 [Cyprinus carpio]|nr:hypothetical protein cypCar_00043294 [Cyprinus carpio]